jgi:hypothetical protein
MANLNQADHVYVVCVKNRTCGFPNCHLRHVGGVCRHIQKGLVELNRVDNSTLTSFFPPFCRLAPVSDFLKNARFERPNLDNISRAELKKVRGAPDAVPKHSKKFDKRILGAVERMTKKKRAKEDKEIFDTDTSMYRLKLHVI